MRTKIETERETESHKELARKRQKKNRQSEGAIVRREMLLNDTSQIYGHLYYLFITNMDFYIHKTHINAPSQVHTYSISIIKRTYLRNSLVIVLINSANATCIVDDYYS